jgi:hypothetical protein
MIKEEDIKVGLRFYITRNDCLKCNFDPIGIQDGSTPILFNAERKDADVYICTSVSTDYKYFARFCEEDIMMFGTKFDIVAPVADNHKIDINSDIEMHENILNNLHDTYIKKNRDYGNAFSEMYDELGINYGYGKIREKVNRIKTLKDNEAQVANEPLEDALLDCANYCILTLMEYQKRKEHGTD